MGLIIAMLVCLTVAVAWREFDDFRDGVKARRKEREDEVIERVCREQRLRQEFHTPRIPSTPSGAKRKR